MLIMSKVQLIFKILFIWGSLTQSAIPFIPGWMKLSPLKIYDFLKKSQILEKSQI